MPGTDLMSVCVFCGSSKGAKEAYAEAGHAIGAALAANNMRLVYGGGSKGVMGAVAAGASSNQGKVLGIIPEIMTTSAPQGHPEDKSEAASSNAPAAISAEGRGEVLLDQASAQGHVETIVVDSMHTRKHRMADESQAFVVLPGGFGTFEEAFEMITWNQIGVHKKPVIIVNAEGFFDHLAALVEKGVTEGFIPAHSAETVRFVNDASNPGPEQLAEATVKTVIESLQKIQSWQGGYWSWKPQVQAKGTV